MHYRYAIFDVFTEQAFGGNQLAVLPDARGLDTTTMQTIAREFNFSETTFVLPPHDPAHTRQVRIFTPVSEMPFAGHPNIGTAFALVDGGYVMSASDELTLLFEEQAGLVPVTVTLDQGRARRAELTAPQALQLGREVNPTQVAAALSLDESDIVDQHHKPRLASAGVAFLCIELRTRAALNRSQVLLDHAVQLLKDDNSIGFLLYTFDTGMAETDIQARMYAPLHGVPEDPATGSAAVALAGLLADANAQASGIFTWRIAQGIEMGRPSLLEARAEKQNGAVTHLYVAGTSVLISEGWIRVPQASA